jgi:hypothetical protein
VKISRLPRFGLTLFFALSPVSFAPPVEAFPSPPEGPGRIEFDQGSFHALESSGLAVITVEREHGTQGQVTIDYATSDLTATAGADYTAVSGTLVWPDGDGADKTILVPLVVDDVDEGTERVLLTLSNPTGGAELRPQHATSRLIITEPDDEEDDEECDDDGDGDGNSHGRIRFVEESYQVIEGQLNALVTVERTGGNQGNVAVDFAADPGSATAGADFTPVTGTLNWAHADGGLRTFAVPIVDDDLAEETEDVLLTLSNPVGGAVITDGDSLLEILDDDAPSTTCAPSDETLCLLGGRFKAEITYRTATVGSGVGHASPLSNQSGTFWFFDEDNAEMLIKVINGCSQPGLQAYWVFFAATTNVDFTLTVTDTHSGVSRQYRNPYGLAARPVQDVRTFACTP